jgi:hypothetical protein
MSKVFDPSNQFTFACPIFGAVTKIAHCIELRDRVFKGQKPEVRQGCQACISSSKCPVTHIMKDASMGKSIDRYYAAQPVKGALAERLLDRIAAIRTLPNHMDKYGVGDAQRAMIQKANTTFASGKDHDALDDMPATRNAAQRSPLRLLTPLCSPRRPAT